MNRHNILFAIIVGVITAGCRTNPTSDDSIVVYNQILDQVVLHYYESCFTPDMNHEKIMEEYFSGKIDSTRYSQSIDSLIDVRKKSDPKCVLEYYDEIGNIFKNNRLSEDMVNSIKTALEDQYVKESFGGVDIQSILDSVANTSKLDARELTVDYLQILPHIKEDKYPWGHGMGVIGLSKIFFNNNFDRAIVYYEFNCGSKCGTGEIVFLKRANDKWKIVEYKRIWDS